MLADNQVQAKAGPTAEYDVLRSEEEVALRQEDLLAARNTFSQDAQSLKSKISRSFNEQLAAIEVVPTTNCPSHGPPNSASDIMNRHGALQVEELAGKEPDTAATIDREARLVYARSSQADEVCQSAGGARMFVWQRPRSL